MFPKWLGCCISWFVVFDDRVVGNVGDDTYHIPVVTGILCEI